MGLFDNCLLACDVDGTLLADGYFPPQNIEKIEYFAKEGGKVCLATGRTVPALDPVLAIYDGFSPCVTGNGTVIFDPKTGEILDRICLPESDKELVKKIYNAIPSVGIELHCDRSVYTLRQTGETDTHQSYEFIKSEFIDENAVDLLNINKALYLFDDMDDENATKKIISEDSTESVFIDTRVMIEGVERHYLEHIPPAISKFAGVKRLMKILGIKNENLFCIGDNYNDYQMVKNGYISGCPADATEDVKSAATKIFCAAKDGAVAEFIDYLKEEKINGRK